VASAAFSRSSFGSMVAGKSARRTFRLEAIHQLIAQAQHKRQLHRK